MPAADFLEQMRELTLARVTKIRREERLKVLADQEKNPPRSADALGLMAATPRPHLVAEIKRRSPSRGPLAENLDIAELAKDYEAAGAAAISILTEPHFFGGATNDLAEVRKLLPSMPLLMKDFILHSVQLHEARLLGADMILLIHRFLGSELLQELYLEALDLGLSPLVEIHDEDEFDDSVRIGAPLIGVNNRNLQTLTVDISNTIRIARHCQFGKTVVIAESGIESAQQISELSRVGYSGVLIGSKLMQSADRRQAIRELLDRGSV